MSDAPRADDAGEDLGVRLEWPMDPIDDPFAPPEEPATGTSAGGDTDQAPAQPAPAPPSPVPSMPGPVPSMATALEALRSSDAVAGLAAVAARIDVLTTVTTTFRTQLADRISQTQLQLSELLVMQREQPIDVESRLGRRLDALEAAVAPLAGVPQTLAAIEDAIAALTKDVQGLRRRVAMRGRAAALDADQIGEVAEAVAAQLEPERSTPPRRRRPPRPS